MVCRVGEPSRPDARAVQRHSAAAQQCAGFVIGRSAARNQASAQRGGRSSRQAAPASAGAGSAQVPEKLERELERLRTELAKRDTWTKQLEARAATADQRADDVQAELEQERLAHKRAQRAARGADDAEKMKQKLDELEARARDEHSALEQSRAETAALRDELGRLEDLLAERAKRVNTLEQQLHHGERTGQQLLNELRLALDAQAERDANGSPSSQRLLERQAERLAELEGDLEAARWTIQELEGKLS